MWIDDVSDSKLWQEGVHFEKHRAELDLPNFLEQTSHGQEKVVSMPRVGQLTDPAEKAPTPLHQKAFYVLAYFNPVLVFLKILSEPAAMVRSL
jgi:hypothetical protein